MNRSGGEAAWLVLEWLKGRSQKEIARELGTSSSVVCSAIRGFCDRWSGIDVERQYIYGEERKQVAYHALQTFHFQGTNNDIRKPYFGPPLPCSEEQYGWARCEHAWLLRAEGLTLAAIGDRLDVSRERARQMIFKFGRRFTRAVWRARWDATLQKRAKNPVL